MLEARDLGATRGGVTLFGGIAFTLRPGALLRVTGANGSGKTSLLRVLCGIARPDTGEVHWDSKSVLVLREEYWKHLAYVGHANALKDELTAAENLEISCALAGLDATPARIQAAIGQLGL